MLEPGDKAPAFTLEDQDGKKVSLRDFAGKKLILYFYPKDMTPGCTREAAAFQEHLTRIRRKGAEVVGVSRDSAASHRRFCDQLSLKFPLLSDPDATMIQAYGVWQEKVNYGKKYMGIVRTTYVIDEKGKVAAVFPKVKVDGHAEKVLEAL
jgi:peroxiredoxin Q/BCP